MSNSANTQVISIEVLGKTYSVRCPVGETQSLYAAARELNQDLLQRSTNRGQQSRDQVTVLAALNFAHKSLQMAPIKMPSNSEGSGRIQALKDKIEEKLAKDRQFDV